MKKNMNNKMIYIAASFMVMLLLMGGGVPSIAQGLLASSGPSAAAYSLRVAFDEPSISPLPGSIISGRVVLLQNGEPSKSIPADLWPDNVREQFTPQLDIKVGGVRNVYYYRGEYEYGRESSQHRLAVSESALLKTQIFSPQATNQWDYPINGDKFLATLDFSSGDAQFSYVYGGGAVGNKLTFDFTARFFDTNVLASEVLPFGSGIDDIIRSQDLNRQVKGNFYYDVSFDTISVNKDRQRHVKITITAKETHNNQIYDNPYQRVRVVLRPIRVEYDPNARDFIAKTTFYYPGQFRGTKLFVNEKANWAKTAVYHSSYKLRDYPQNVRSEPYENNFNAVELDLVNGKGEVWFTYEGQQGFVPYVSFRVSPTDYTRGNRQYASNSTSYRTKLEIPRRPPDFVMLYGTWMKDDSLAERVFTIASLPIANPAANYVPPSLGSPVEVILEDIENNSLKQNYDAVQPQTPTTDGDELPLAKHNRQAIWWLIGFHISVVLLGGALIFILKRKRKSYGKN
ncbi:hypothetical protein DRH29_01300 [candidate division Kazan bacterium]|uniref:Uncharacterized protein n=1 Tax=candidate division Kazan bacterium TaxID=2202143 RepID=A0A420ZDK6_UNCK3|nr:MAG: hypothetical protein DRH29_01300 [candidate division Kazan bacterium]